MVNLIKRLWQDEQGQDLAEYGIALAVIALAVITAVSLLGDEISKAFDKARGVLETAGN